MVRQRHYSATLKHMLKIVESQPNLTEGHLRFVKLMKSEEQPSVMDIMEIKDLFFHGPLSLSKLPIPYVRFENYQYFLEDFFAQVFGIFYM